VEARFHGAEVGKESQLTDPFLHAPKRPFVQTAGFYNYLIMEQSGIATGVSLLENITSDIDLNLNASAVAGTMAIPADLRFLIQLGGLKAGANQIEVHQWTPYGGPFPTVVNQMNADPPLYRIQLRGELTLMLTIDQIGWHWFEIVVNGESIAAMPIEIRMTERARSYAAKTLSEAVLPTNKSDSEFE
jgi:hypothetical protein